jgi:hypothetical protein
MKADGPTAVQNSKAERSFLSNSSAISLPSGQSRRRYSRALNFRGAFAAGPRPAGSPSFSPWDSLEKEEEIHENKSRINILHDRISPSQTIAAIYKVIGLLLLIFWNLFKQCCKNSTDADLQNKTGQCASRKEPITSNQGNLTIPAPASNGNRIGSILCARRQTTIRRTLYNCIGPVKSLFFQRTWLLLMNYRIIHGSFLTPDSAQCSAHVLANLYSVCSSF